MWPVMLEFTRLRALTDSLVAPDASTPAARIFTLLETE